ncbi:tRNA (adenosine(37)-N6)-dimethylallyltransferase MiaA [Trichothermofontia sp.]
MPLPPRLIVICGPTATGKSRLALTLAQRLPAIILSADSRQVYRGFDIGTAKPSPQEQAQVPHCLIDICDPTVTLTVSEYQAQAQALISQDHHAGQVPLLVGGTGLYIKSIVRGMKIPRVSPQPALRSQLESLDQTQNYALLQQVDPQAAAKIHPHDRRRTIRALEVFYVTGIPISQQQGESPPDYPILQIGLDCPNPEDLTVRITQRTEQMLAMGLVAEVMALRDRYGADLPLLQTLGYQEVMQYLDHQLSLEDAKAAIILHTRQLAKQQRTWFRADAGIEWFDCDQPDLGDTVWHKVKQFLSHSPAPGEATGLPGTDTC